MKEDVLEQIVDDYLQHRGYFTMHNVRFRPERGAKGWSGPKDSVHSDVDVVGINPRLRGPNKVWVVSCKSWQAGFSADRWLEKLEGGKNAGPKEAWKYLRELWDEKWSDAFRTRIEELTGSRQFTYSIAVTRLRGDRDAWNRDATIRARLGGNPFKFLTVAEMWEQIVAETTRTQAGSEIGRLAQVLKAAGVVQIGN